MELIVFLSVFGLAALVAGIWACVQIHKTDQSKKSTIFAESVFDNMILR